MAHRPRRTHRSRRRRIHASCDCWFPTGTNCSPRGRAGIARTITPEQAFAALRTISQRRNIKLRVVAAELVETISRREPETKA
ncbi:MAG: ANTAR domain-containing protein [Actinomycetota bacterium]|nr:ANTAR domain-containing protein [Actinomycetota bacterium]